MPRGKKTCPKCHTDVGPRLKVCECGYQFPFKQSNTRTPPGFNVDAATTGRTPPYIAKADENGTFTLYITVTDREELRSFIKQLKECFDKSDQTCGGYAAFLRHKTGMLQVDVCFPIPEATIRKANG